MDCDKCKGSGTEYYWNHGYGEESVEPIKCSNCDGFGYVDLLSACGTFDTQDCISVQDLWKIVEQEKNNE